MIVTKEDFKVLQSLIYDGEFSEEYIPLYADYAEFCETDIQNPVYIRLLEGLLSLEVK